MKKTHTARTAAADILALLYSTKKPIKPLMEELFSRSELSPLDRGMTMQLVYGVLRQRQRLDRIIQILSRVRLRKLDPFLHQVLAVGLFQLFFLDRIPESAAVNEAVNSMKWAGKNKKLQGFCNGILREAIRQKKKLYEQSMSDHRGQRILNHPEWMTERWKEFWGYNETARICTINSQEPSLVIRVNTSRISVTGLTEKFREEGVTCHPGRYSESALVITESRGTISSLPGFAEGFFQVQDEAAQLATGLLKPIKAGGKYLDGCAGLGGKTSHLLDLCADKQVEIHAVEPEPYRLQKLRENIARNFPDGKVCIHEGLLEQLDKTVAEQFDGILIDAPCSGTGVTGRHPDIRWNRGEEDFAAYQQRQQALLETAARMVCPGGILVYATCSLEPEENIEVIGKFSETHAEFTVTDCKPFLPATAHKFVSNKVFCPHPDTTIDGFFAARLQKSAG